MHFSWQSPAIRGVQSDYRYVNNNKQITCRSHARALRTVEMELPLVKLTVELLRIQRVTDVARPWIRIEWLGKNCHCPNCQRIVLKAQK